MNQILITGDEPIVSKETQHTFVAKERKEKKVLPINLVTKFYATSIMILGFCMAAGSAFACYQINRTIEENIKPEISFKIDNDNNKIEIKVNHIRKIQSFTYKWNDEKEIEIKGDNRKTITETIDLLGGKNTLSADVIDEKGKTQKLSKTYEIASIPVIETLEPVENGVKIIVKGEEKLEYLQYTWDDGEKQKIKIGKQSYEGIISAPKGKHTLKIEIVDETGRKAKLEREVIGDTEPTLNVQSKLIDGKMVFVIDAEDDEKLTKMSIIHNAGEEQIIDINAKTYHKEVLMTEGEENKIIITVTNENGLEKVRRIKFTNK